MCNTIKLKDFFNTRAKDEVECGKEVIAFKQLMSFAMPIIYWLPWFEEWEEIDVSGWAFTTQKPIYFVRGFRAKRPAWCSCNCSCNICTDACFEPEEWCADCEWCNSELWKISMRNNFMKWELITWRYNILCPQGKDITYKLPKWITKAYIYYTRWLENIDDVEAEIEIPEYLLWPLWLLVKYFSRNDGTEARRLNDFNEAISRLQYLYAPEAPDSIKFVGKDNRYKW